MTTEINDIVRGVIATILLVRHILIETWNADKSVYQDGI